LPYTACSLRSASVSSAGSGSAGSVVGEWLTAFRFVVWASSPGPVLPCVTSLVPTSSSLCVLSSSLSASRPSETSRAAGALDPHASLVGLVRGRVPWGVLFLVPSNSWLCAWVRIVSWVFWLPGVAEVSKTHVVPVSWVASWRRLCAGISAAGRQSRPIAGLSRPCVIGGSVHSLLWQLSLGSQL
jgi:hypothetical protein